jgi:hypothetical protein
MSKLELQKLKFDFELKIPFINFTPFSLKIKLFYKEFQKPKAQSEAKIRPYKIPAKFFKPQHINNLGLYTSTIARHSKSALAF